MDSSPNPVFSVTQLSQPGRPPVLVSSEEARARTLASLDAGPLTAKQLREATGYSRRYLFEILRDLRALRSVVALPNLHDTRQQWFVRAPILMLASPPPTSAA